MSAPADFEGRVAFVTGAAHGQGRAVALALAAAGADIVGFDVAAKIEYPAYAQGSGAELDSLKAEVEGLGRRALVFAGDVRDAAAIQHAVAIASDQRVARAPVAMLRVHPASSWRIPLGYMRNVVSGRPV